MRNFVVECITTLFGFRRVNFTVNRFYLTIKELEVIGLNSETHTRIIIAEWCYKACVRSVQLRSFFWSVFSCIRIEYGDLLFSLWTLFTQWNESGFFFHWRHHLHLCKTNFFVGDGINVNKSGGCCCISLHLPLILTYLVYWISNYQKAQRLISWQKSTLTIDFIKIFKTQIKICYFAWTIFERRTISF